MTKQATFFIIGVLCAGLVCAVVPVLADNYGLDETATAAKLVRDETPAQIVGKVVGAALSLVGVLFFILMIYAGITWMLARGASDKTETALKTIIAAIIGLIITLASYAITNFVLKETTGGAGGGGTPQVQKNDEDCKAKQGECQANAAATCLGPSFHTEPGLCHGTYSAATTLCCIPGP